MNVLSTVDIGSTTVLSVRLYFSYLRLFPPEAPTQFTNFGKNNNIFYKHVHRKLPKMLRNQNCILCLNSISSYKDNGPTLVL